MSDNESNHADSAADAAEASSPRAAATTQDSSPRQQESTTTAAGVFDIFGGDLSDLSDVDSDEEEAVPKRPAAALSPRRDQDDDDDDNDDASDRDFRAQEDAAASADEANKHADKDDDDDDDEYEYREQDLRKLKIAKRKGPREARDAEAEPRRKKKKTKERAEQHEEEEQVDPETARRRALDAKLEAIIKKPKRAGGKKKKNANEDDLEMMNDEAVATLRRDMLDAADRDVEDNERGRYAVHKLRLLPRVVEMMQKTALAEPLIEAGALEAVRKWLEPLPDKSLPAVNIQRSLFEILRTLSIETSALKSSGLGKIVYFYTKCKRVEPGIARMANQLVSDWIRPIIRRSKQMTDRLAPNDFDDIDNDDDDNVPGYGEYDYATQQQKRAQASQGASGGAVAKRHARIPNQLSASFKIAPPADPNQRAEKIGAQLQSQGVAVGGTKIRSYKNKLKMGQAASRRV
ncbi:Transcription factor iws1 [Microbotryomycetes sp. JL221]|nr:Transcription factor iws1 [Microbotryomycetes sp. JL221]